MFGSGCGVGSVVVVGRWEIGDSGGMEGQTGGREAEKFRGICPV